MKCNRFSIVVGVAAIVAAMAATGMVPRAFAQTEQTLFNFSQIGGDGSGAGLTWDKPGKHLYGTSSSGGTTGAGLVFELSEKKGKWTPSVIYEFNSSQNTDGASPSSSLTLHDGAYYGVTQAGGDPACGNCGVVFELKKVKGVWTETVLHSFEGGLDGAVPYGGVVFDSKGNIYGTTTIGGGSTNCEKGCGTIYKLAKVRGVWTVTILHAFTAWPADANPGQFYDGADPHWCTPVFDAQGNMYGTTAMGGLYEYSGTSGTVWKLTPGEKGAWNYQIIYNFDRFTQPDDGTMPLAGVTVGPDGNLYGAAEFGGVDANSGALFEVDTNGSSESTIFSFDYSNGENPESPLVFDGEGNLYGTTWTGGSPDESGDGAVFELSPGGSGWSQSLLFGFSGSNGEALSSPVVLDSSRNIYGTTTGGGSDGVVFEITP